MKKKQMQLLTVALLSAGVLSLSGCQSQNRTVETTAATTETAAETVSETATEAASLAETESGSIRQINEHYPLIFL